MPQKYVAQQHISIVPFLHSLPVWHVLDKTKRTFIDHTIIAGDKITTNGSLSTLRHL